MGLAGSVDRFLNQKVVPGIVIFPPPLHKKAPGGKKKHNVRTMLALFSLFFRTISGLWTPSGSGGGPGADVGEIPRSIGPLLAPFWGHFLNKMLIF